MDSRSNLFSNFEMRPFKNTIDYWNMQNVANLLIFQFITDPIIDCLREVKAQLHFKEPLGYILFWWMLNIGIVRPKSCQLMFCWPGELLTC